MGILLRRTKLQSTVQSQQKTLAEQEKNFAELNAEKKLLQKEETKLQSTVQSQQKTLAEQEKNVAELNAEKKLLQKEASKLQSTTRSQEEALADKDQQIAAKVLAVEQMEITQRMLEEKMSEIQYYLDAIQNSRSWKLTTPLRNLYDLLPATSEWQRYMRQRLTLKLVTIRKLQHLCDLPLTPVALKTNDNYSHGAVHWIASLKVYNQAKRALLAHPPSTVKYRLKVPPNSVLQTFVALHPSAWGQNQNGVEFIISVSALNNSRSQTKKCWSNPTRFSQHRHWMEFRMSLRRFADQEVDLTLSTSVSPGAQTNYAWAVWGEPSIVTPRRRGSEQSTPDQKQPTPVLQTAYKKSMAKIAPMHNQTPEQIAANEKHLNSVRHPKYEKAVCTVVSKNYLAFARVFTRSFLKHHPDVKVFVLLVDNVDGYFNAATEPFELILIEDLDNIPNPRHLFFFKYTVIELNTAVKPYLFQYLFGKYSIAKLIYFDPDILVLHPLERVWELLDEHTIVLTPHLTEPILDNSRPSEIDILRAGTYNLGFIAMASTPSVQDFLQWWQKRLYDFCSMEPDKGIHVDQKWIDLVPEFFEGSFILRDPEYNIAYWNLHSRAKVIKIRGKKVNLNGNPVQFFHFSGFDPNNIKQVSKYQDRFTLKKLPNLSPLFKRYRNLLLAEGFNETRNWPYVYGFFDNGVRIPDSARKMYRESSDTSLVWGNPFVTESGHSFFAWLNQSVEALDKKASDEPVITQLWYEIYKTRSDIQQACRDVFGRHRDEFIRWITNCGRYEYSIDPCFLPKYHNACAPSLLGQKLTVDATATAKTSTKEKQEDQKQDESRFRFGINLVGYFNSEKGLGTAVRSHILELEAVGIPYVLNNVEDSGSENSEKVRARFSNDNPYKINLIHINADALPSFTQCRNEYFVDRHNIGYWVWELSSFPEEWYDRFKPFDEIWVPSNFALDAISRVSPIPVVRVPHSIRPIQKTNQRQARAQFGLEQETFVVLFMFDFHSYIERKNPFGVVRAFKEAFTDKEDAVLFIKCSHSSFDPESRALLQNACKRENIRLLDAVIPRRDIDALISTCNCYVSLHRCEGFGLTIAEPMSLGKPVIATAYSGNLDFMTPSNSFLVKYSLVEIDTDHGPYKKGSLWADPDLDHAAQLMRYVYENPAEAAKVAENAKQTVIDELHPKIVGRMIKERLLAVRSRRGSSESLAATEVSMQPNADLTSHSKYVLNESIDSQANHRQFEG